MTIEFNCPDCNKTLRTRDDKAGARAKCPDCGATITVPKPEDKFDFGGFDDDATQDAEEYGSPYSSAPTQPVAGLDPGMKNCPMCGAQIRSAAAKCRFCGETVGTRPPSAGRRRRSGVSEARSRVQAPAICLIVFASLYMVFAAISLFANLAQINDIQRQRGFGQRQQQLPRGVIVMIIIGVLVVQLSVSGVVLAGAIKMKNLRSRGFALTAAILAMLPCSLCCLLGLPFGIWALVVLNDADVKAAFRS